MLEQKVSNHFSIDGLPVEECLTELHHKLQSSPLVALKAPPGSGKTILCPTALLERGGFRNVYILEPRRVTARLPALALREVLGPLVGYRIRLENLWQNDKTRLGYLTYGTALRVFLQKPPRPDDLVIFDEFHERSWEAELLLAILRARTPKPRLLLMSATLDIDSLPDDLPVVESDGRLHPVTLSWESRDPQHNQDRRLLASLLAERSQEWASRDRREQLIFLPGISYIRAAEEKLLADHISGPVDILHSSLDESEIRRVVERNPDCGFRRILSTDLAESSVTLPGIGVVLDAGLVRRPVRDQLDLGITLKTLGAPKSSLEQRAGRAGRLGPGFCHRLFTKTAEIHRDQHPEPQLEQADYRTLSLFLSSVGFLSEVAKLPWLYQPCPNRLASSISWCKSQTLLTKKLHLTSKGEQVLRLSLEPRIANFALTAMELGLQRSEVVRLSLSLSQGAPGRGAFAVESAGSKGSTDKRLKAQIESVLPAVKNRSVGSTDEAFLLSYSDCLARFSAERAVCAQEEQSALQFEPQGKPQHEFGLILSTQPRGGGGPRSSVGLYHPVSKEQVWETLFDQLTEHEELEYQPNTRSVKLKREVRLGSLVIESEVGPAPAGPATAELIFERLTPQNLPPAFESLCRRLQLYFEHGDESPEDIFQGLLDGDNLGDRLLKTYLTTTLTWSKSSGSELMCYLDGLIPYHFRQQLNKELPLHVELPRRKRPVKVNYPLDGAPYMASKLQDFFGWEPPSLLGGRVKLLLHLLAPNRRACQITDDLEGFWRGSYVQVRKDLRGRYPKHDWPEDPTRMSTHSK